MKSNNDNENTDSYKLKGQPGFQVKIKIKYKLFLILLLSSFFVATGMFLYMQWSFDRGFLDYVNSRDIVHLEKLADKLTRAYGKHGNWQFLRGNQTLWHQIMRDVKRVPVHDRFPGLSDRTAPSVKERQRPKDPRSVGPRLVVFDADKKKVIGNRPDNINTLKLRTLGTDKNIIGYLSLIPIKKLSDAGDLQFVEQQFKSIGFVAMVLFSLLLTLPIAGHLLRPIKALTDGTQKLISGKFKNRIPVSTRDELGKLSVDFNTLATTLEETEKARKQWVADISHELRTPLSVLRGEIEALQDGVRESGPEAFHS